MAVREFGRLEGEAIAQATIRSAEGAQAEVISWGAVVRDLVVPTRAGNRRVVLGLQSLEDYVARSPHFGAIAGRFANRIRDGRFSLDGRSYDLPRNENGRTSLHGGGQGFGKRPWRLVEAREDAVRLALHSPDGDAGYPGALDVACTYSLAGATLRVALEARADAPTPVNLCHHSYFTLDDAETILDHEIEIAADFYTPLDPYDVPTGEVLRVEGSPYDLRTARPVRREADGERLRFDNNFALARTRTEPSGIETPLAFAARVRSPESGVVLEVWTTEPGLQFYDGYKTDLDVPGHDGRRYGPCSGLCLEPQHFPDSPNQPHFPSTILRPGAVYRQVTEYRFG